MSLLLPYQLKRFIRLCDARFVQRIESVHLRDEEFQFYETHWWPNSSQAIFDQEIAPYFEVLYGDQRHLATVLDIGAASGHFAIPLLKMFPAAQLVAFEPALRQRILLVRNALLNNVHNIDVEPFGLWYESDVLAFRTNGAESSFAPVSRFAGDLPFPEKVRVKSLDEWVSERQPATIDLIKADAEGAELAILEGARQTLLRYRPLLLIQAYHLVEGRRTFERCAQLLSELGYSIDEPFSGLLHAI